MTTNSSQRIVPVLAGGGTRFAAHLGVLHALHDLNLQYDHIVGVSGGSIVASFAASGHGLEDMKKLLYAANFAKYREFSILNLLIHGGLSTGKKFEQWLDQQLKGARFGDLPKKFYIVATDVRSGKPVVFGPETHPDLAVSRAVLYSISIPLIFPFHHYGEHVLVDGSILAEDQLFQDWAGDRTPVVCFRIRDKRVAADHPARRILPVVDYMFMLVRTFMNTISREYLSDALWLNTVLIETEGMSPLEFNVSQEQKQSLFNSGYRTTHDILPGKLARVLG